MLKGKRPLTDSPPKTTDKILSERRTRIMEGTDPHARAYHYLKSHCHTPTRARSLSTHTDPGPQPHPRAHTHHTHDLVNFLGKPDRPIDPPSSLWHPRGPRPPAWSDRSTARWSGPPPSCYWLRPGSPAGDLRPFH